MSSSPEQKQLEKQIRQVAPGLLNNLPGEKKQQLMQLFGTLELVQHTASAQVTHTTTSPVPPAELLEGYNRAITDGGNRLFSMIERQSSHRQEIETKVIDAQTKALLRGQVCAAAMTVLLIAAGVYFGYTGHDKISMVIFATTIGAVAALFIAGKVTQQKEVAAKKP